MKAGTNSLRDFRRRSVGFSTAVRMDVVFESLRATPVTAMMDIAWTWPGWLAWTSMNVMKRRICPSSALMGSVETQMGPTSVLVIEAMWCPGSGTSAYLLGREHHRQHENAGWCSPSPKNYLVLCVFFIGEPYEITGQGSFSNTMLWQWQRIYFLYIQVNVEDMFCFVRWRSASHWSLEIAANILLYFSALPVLSFRGGMGVENRFYFLFNEIPTFLSHTFSNPRS